MISTASHLATLPEGEHKNITIRSAIAGEKKDVLFLDHLQKKFSHQVGFLPKVALEAHIARGKVSIALENDEPAAYLLGKGNYLRDPHFGIIYQAAVSYDARRRLIGTALVQHFMDVMEPNIRLIGLWCAQDIEANEFWNACGFEAIAARHGSRRKGRVHIFWVGRTPGKGAREPLRYPKVTRGGLMREQREVYGLEPGDEWKKVELPELAPEHPLAVSRRPSAGRGRKAQGSRLKARGSSKASLAEMQRALRYGQSKHICVVIAGVTKYLPVAPFDLPDFADLARVSVATMEGEQKSRISRPSRGRPARALWTPASVDDSSESREAA